MNAIESLRLIRPELLLGGAAFVILILDFFVSKKAVLGWLSVLVIAAALFLSPAVSGSQKLFFGYFILDPMTHYFKIAALLTVGLTILASLAYRGMAEHQRGELYALLISSALLLIIMGGVNNLLMIFLAIESVSLVSYLLVAFQKFDKRSSEAAVKYVLFGAVSSAVMLFGMSLLFGLTGTLWIAEIGKALAIADHATQSAGLIGLALLLVGIGFKISMAPFHMWAPDVYQGAATPITAFLTVAPKALGFAVLARVLALAFPDAGHEWTHILGALAVLTMTFGNIIAISQSDVKRLLAYSSVAQAGYILVGLAVQSRLGLEAVLIYVMAYLFTNLGAFFTVLAVERETGSNKLEAYNGLAQRSPLLAVSMALFMLSLAGIPPLVGFFGKVYIFSAAVEAKATGLAIAVALNSAIAAFYYFKIVKAMYLTPAASNEPFKNPLSIKLAIAGTLLGTLLLGLWPANLIQTVQNTLSNFPLF